MDYGFIKVSPIILYIPKSDEETDWEPLGDAFGILSWAFGFPIASPFHFYCFCEVEFICSDGFVPPEGVKKFGQW